MCGRYTLRTPAGQLAEFFQLTLFPQLGPRYNIAPTQLVVCVRAVVGDPLVREAVSVRWGLIPFWAKDPSIGSRMINARSETAEEKPAFRKAFESRRCIIPADGFFEWEKRPNGSRQPWLIQLPDGRPFGFAGLWERWQPKESPAVESCTILTTNASGDLRDLHDRMPVILSPEQHAGWLSASSSHGQLRDIMTSLPEGTLIRYPVSTLVNKAGHDEPACIEPLVPPAAHTSSEPKRSGRQQSLFE